MPSAPGSRTFSILARSALRAFSLQQFPGSSQKARNVLSGQKESVIAAQKAVAIGAQTR
jgi:hypothetical protein